MPTFHICELCNQQASKYTCPKCKVKYCSLSCYKLAQQVNTDAPQSKTGSDKIQVHEKCLRLVQDTKEKDFRELLKTVNNKENRRDVEKVQKILIKDWEEGGEGGAEYNDDISLASEEMNDIVQKMTPDELKKFQSFCETFASSSLELGDKDSDELLEKIKSSKAKNDKGPQMKMKLWEPWWRNQDMFSAGRGLVQEVGLEGEESATPVIPINPLKLNPAKPLDPRLNFHIVDLLLAYVCSCKVLNGEAEGLAEMLDTFSYIISSSVDLSVKSNAKHVSLNARHAAGRNSAQSFLYNNLQEVVDIFKNRLLSSGYSSSKEATLIFIQDVVLMLESRVEFAQAALSDMIRAFRISPSTMHLSKKCTFFLALYNSLSRYTFDQMVCELRAVAARERDGLISSSSRISNKAATASTRTSADVPLIQEIASENQRKYVL